MMQISFDKDISKSLRGFINNKVKQRKEIDVADLSYSVVYKKVSSDKEEHNTENYAAFVHFFLLSI